MFNIYKYDNGDSLLTGAIGMGQRTPVHKSTDCADVYQILQLLTNFLTKVNGTIVALFGPTTCKCPARGGNIQKNLTDVSGPF